MRTMISDILAQAGFEIVGEAETGSQAVEKYRQLKPDLVTMDIVMPDMGGIDAVRVESLLDVRRRGAHPPTDELLQLLFRARDALERAVELSVVGRERELEVAEIVADLDHAALRLARAKVGAAAEGPREAGGVT